MSLAAITDSNLPDRGRRSSMTPIRGPRLPLSMAASLVVHLALFSGALIWFSPEGGLSEPAGTAATARISGPIEISLVAWSPPAPKPVATPEKSDRPKPKPAPRETVVAKPEMAVVKTAPAKEAITSSQPVATETNSGMAEASKDSSAMAAGEAGSQAGAGDGSASTSPAGESAAPVFVSEPKFRVPPRPPVYPLRAQRLGQHGEALIRARLDRRGMPADVRLWKSTGHVLLDNAALAAVRRWQFEPARRQGIPVEGWVQIPVRFALKN
ncbi:MAG: TonB family protein [Rhizobiales bacterium]|nr:TonB family protein [Hyphomicrobiales bacterium]